MESRQARFGELQCCVETKLLWPHYGHLVRDWWSEHWLTDKATENPSVLVQGSSFRFLQLRPSMPALGGPSFGRDCPSKGLVI